MSNQNWRRYKDNLRLRKQLMRNLKNESKREERNKED